MRQREVDWGWGGGWSCAGVTVGPMRRRAGWAPAVVAAASIRPFVVPSAGYHTWVGGFEAVLAVPLCIVSLTDLQTCFSGLGLYPSFVFFLCVCRPDHPSGGCRAYVTKHSTLCYSHRVLDPRVWSWPLPARRPADGTERRPPRARGHPKVTPSPGARTNTTRAPRPQRTAPPRGGARAYPPAPPPAC